MTYNSKYSLTKLIEIDLNVNDMYRLSVGYSVPSIEDFECSPEYIQFKNIYKGIQLIENTDWDLGEEKADSSIILHFSFFQMSSDEMHSKIKDIIIDIINLIQLPIEYKRDVLLSLMEREVSENYIISNHLSYFQKSSKEKAIFVELQHLVVDKVIKKEYTIS